MSWDDAAATWDADVAVQTYSRAAFRSLQEALAARGAALSGARVLDFGCGTGLLTAAMAAEADAVIGVDTAAEMRKVLEGKGISNVTTAAGLDALEGTVDLITCSSVLSFVPDYPATVRQLAAVLAPGGLLVQWDWELDPTADEPHGLSQEAIRAALTAAGLADVAVDVGFREPFSGQIMAPVRGIGRKP